MAKEKDDRALYIISVAAELAGMHPQTLRIYERKGLLRPSRTAGNTRRYSQSDIERLREINELTKRGVNLAGVKMIMEMQSQLQRVRKQVEEMNRELERQGDDDQAPSQESKVVPLDGARVTWKDPAS